MITQYFVYSATVYDMGSNKPRTVNGVYSSKGVISLFKMAEKKPEYWAITSWAEISKDQFKEWDAL